MPTRWPSRGGWRAHEQYHRKSLWYLCPGACSRSLITKHGKYGALDVDGLDFRRRRLYFRAENPVLQKKLFRTGFQDSTGFQDFHVTVT